MKNMKIEITDYFQRLALKTRAQYKSLRSLIKPFTFPYSQELYNRKKKSSKFMRKYKNCVPWKKNFSLSKSIFN